MRVRLKANLNVPQIDQVPLATWIKEDAEYVVMEIDGPLLRILDDPDNDGGGLWKAEYFDVTDSHIPPNWVVELGAKGRICLAPRRWLEPGFWEAIYDDDSPDLTWAQHNARYREAHEIYDEEMKIILG